MSMGFVAMSDSGPFTKNKITIIPFILLMCAVGWRSSGLRKMEVPEAETPNCEKSGIGVVWELENDNLVRKKTLCQHAVVNTNSSIYHIMTVGFPKAVVCNADCGYLHRAVIEASDPLF
jgi:hypothetical protein